MQTYTYAHVCVSKSLSINKCVCVCVFFYVHAFPWMWNTCILMFTNAFKRRRHARVYAKGPPSVSKCESCGFENIIGFLSLFTLFIAYPSHFPFPYFSSITVFDLIYSSLRLFSPISTFLFFFFIFKHTSSFLFPLVVLIAPLYLLL